MNSECDLQLLRVLQTQNIQSFDTSTEAVCCLLFKPSASKKTFRYYRKVNRHNNNFKRDSKWYGGEKYLFSKMSV